MESGCAADDLVPAGKPRVRHPRASRQGRPVHQGACPRCPHTAHARASTLSHHHSPTESLRCGSRGLQASHFDFSWWCDLHPTQAHPPTSHHAQFINLVMFCSRAFPAFVRSADFGVDWGLTEIRQAGSEVSLFGVGDLCVGSWAAVHTSSPPWSTRPPQYIDRIILIQVGLRVRRLSTPAAPNLAAAHTRPAAQPHMLRARAIHIYIPSPSPCTIPAALDAPRTAFARSSQRASNRPTTPHPLKCRARRPLGVRR